MEKLKCLGVDEIHEELTPEECANLDDSVAVTEPFLSDDSFLAMVCKVEQPVEVASDEEDDDDTVEVNDKLQKNSALIELRSAIETLMDFSFFMKSE